jgi:hypothetical protein
MFWASPPHHFTFRPIDRKQSVRFIPTARDAWLISCHLFEGKYQVLEEEEEEEEEEIMQLLAKFL